jgi:hypothetical protein
LRSLSAIPTNWREVCLITDSTKGLELIPGVEVFPHGPLIMELQSEATAQMRMSFALLFRILFRPNARPDPAQPELMPRDWSSAFKALTIATVIPVFILCILPSVVPMFIVFSALIITHVLAWWYRISLKSTAIIWLPLLYIAADIVPRDWSAGRRLETICTAATARVMRVYAFAVGILLLVKIGSQIVWYKTIVAMERSYEWLSVVSPLVRPIDVPVWQVCSLINAAGAWGLLFFADWQLRKRKDGEGWSDKTVDYWLSWTSIIRWGITLYTSICTLYALYVIVKNSHPPAWEYRLFPWEW